MGSTQLSSQTRDELLRHGNVDALRESKASHAWGAYGCTWRADACAALNPSWSTAGVPCVCHTAGPQPHDHFQICISLQQGAPACRTAAAGCSRASPGRAPPAPAASCPPPPGGFDRLKGESLDQMPMCRLAGMSIRPSSAWRPAHGLWRCPTTLQL